MVSLPNAQSGTMDRISDDDDDEPSSGSETYEEGDLLAAAMDDDVTAQLAAAGWQIKHINGDFHFFAFHFFVYSSSISFVYEASTRCVGCTSLGHHVASYYLGIYVLCYC